MMPDDPIPESLGDRPPLDPVASGGDAEVYEDGVVAVDFGDEDE